jgi:hypothetical protein
MLNLTAFYFALFVLGTSQLSSSDCKRRDIYIKIKISFLLLHSLHSQLICLVCLFFFFNFFCYNLLDIHFMLLLIISITRKILIFKLFLYPFQSWNFISSFDVSFSNFFTFNKKLKAVISRCITNSNICYMFKLTWMWYLRFWWKWLRFHFLFQCFSFSSWCW